MKHSTAPWKSAVDARSPARVMSGTDCIALVYLTDGTTKKRDETHAANLALILAAPDLLAALKLARFALDRNIGDAPEFADVEAYGAVVSALAKAGA